MYTKSNIEKVQTKSGLSAPCKEQGQVKRFSEYNQIFCKLLSK
jgi:hypothetical protein